MVLKEGKHIRSTGINGYNVVKEDRAVLYDIHAWMSVMLLKEAELYYICMNCCNGLDRRHIGTGLSYYGS